MIITVEMSHYPLVDIYEGPILDLIKQLKDNPNLVVMTNAMSTYIQGEYDIVMKHLTATLYELYQDGVPSSTVLKIIPSKLPVDRGWLSF